VNFAYTVRLNGTPLFTSLRLNRAGFTDARLARQLAEAEVVRAGIVGTVEIEIGTLAGGVACVDRKWFHVLPPGENWLRASRPREMN
jgi:hypothetical protein